jgi:hypothetical protein
MQQTAPERRSDLGAALANVAERLRRRSIVVVFSDLFGQTNSVQAGLRRLHHARHEVIVLHALDRAELEFPFERATLFRGLESRPDVLAEPHGVRRAYLAAMERFLEQVQSHCRSSQADYQLARTDAPLDAPLTRLLTARSRRRRR